MFRSVKPRVWAFDAEWVPDPLVGRLLYDQPAEASDEEVLQRMWQEGGATAENPTPFLKTVLCKIVSIAAVERRVHEDGHISLSLLSLPRDPENPEEAGERQLLGTFLQALGDHRPQLVGFNSADSDLKIFVQRAVALGVQAAGFCKRPDKPWEGVDYFARGNDWNIDLKTILGGWGKAVPSLNEIAVVSGIPGKMEVDGNQVAQLWLAGELQRIVNYNEFDALTTYLVWLRVAHFAGYFGAEEYIAEQNRVRNLMEESGEKPENAHLKRYLAEWDRLQTLTAGERG